MESYTVLIQKINDPEIFKIWHKRLGHPGAIMMCQIITSSHRHPLKDYKILTNNEYACSACSIGTLITRPSTTKVISESLKVLERIKGDCGPMPPSCGLFKYFMVLIDASTRWSHVSLLSTRNIAFARLLT